MTACLIQPSSCSPRTCWNGTHDPRVMMVCGTNYLGHWKEDRQSLHFSHFGSVWGWATWKRAWALYDASMSAWGDESAKERYATFSPTMRSSRSRLGDSIVSMASLRIATRGSSMELGATRALGPHHRSLGESRREHRQYRWTRLAPGPSLANLEVTPLAFPLRSPGAVAVDESRPAPHSTDLPMV